jgi:prephenate dehydratase
VVVVKLQAAPNTDKEALHRSFMQGYQKAFKAAEQKYKSQLHAKDREIQIYHQESASLYEILKLQAQRPINVKAIAGNNDVNDNSNNLNITGDISGSTISFGDINGQVSNQINQLPPAAPGQPDIQELLSQIQALIQSEGQLSDASRAFALEQLKELVRAAHNPQDSAMKKVAKQSMALLNNISIISGSVQMGVFLKQAWPLIHGFFGL